MKNLVPGGILSCFCQKIRKPVYYATALSGTLLGMMAQASAQQTQDKPVSITIPVVKVNAPRTGYATSANFKASNANLGPLGTRPILKTPASITVVPKDLIVNLQVHTVNDALNYLPSVEIRDQQGFEVSRPQSRGFQSSIVQNTRLDGLNIIGTTAIATENLSGIEVLNGMGGALYGPESPAGVFNYMLAQPTKKPLVRLIEEFTSNGAFTEQGDFSGTTADGKIGYRLNVVQSNGESYVAKSSTDRTLGSVLFDFHPTDDTTIETYYSHYATSAYGLPGSIVYDNGKSTVLPKAMDPTKLGYGQPGAGTDLVTDTGLLKLTHKFNENWTLEVGGLYQNAIRNLWGITNTFTDNLGDYTTTKNFTAIPHFAIASNEAALNGRVWVFGMEHDVTFATNGFYNWQYSSRNSISTVLGKANVNDPIIYAEKPIPLTGGQYESAYLFNQSIITGDTVHFTDKWALQGVLNASFLSSKSYAASGKTNSSNSVTGALSPMGSLIYTPTQKLTAYATVADSVEQGEQAPTGTANANEILSAYRDYEYEIGAKYAVTPRLLLTLDGFRMTRPLANTNATTNIFSVVGTQRNYGIELFAQGDVTREVSVLGGVTYIDARLQNTGVVATNDQLVVGVPRYKVDMAVDYHPEFLYGLAGTAAVHYESARAATNTNNSFAPEYATLDLGVRYTTPFFGHALTGRFEVTNVTDTHYYVSVADGNIVGSPGANTAYLGAPRTFLASLEFDY